MSEPTAPEIPTFQYIRKPDNLEEQQAARIQIAAKYALQVAELLAEFSPWTSRNILEDAKAIFVGEKCPWHFVWVNVGKDYNRPTDIAYRETLLTMGYAPANFKQEILNSYLVFGRDAAFLSLSPQNAAHFKRLAERKVAPPQPEIPNHLRDKFGFLVPPMVDQLTGFCYMYNQQLWFCSAEQLSAYNKRLSDVANGLFVSSNPRVKPESDKTSFLSDRGAEDVLEVLNKNPFS